MDDDRVWEFEESLWTGSSEHYRELIDDACLMVLPSPPYVLAGDEGVAAVVATPRWTTVELSKRRIARAERGLIVVAYQIAARRDERSYGANCPSTYRRRAHDDWQVVQHQQTPLIT